MFYRKYSSLPYLEYVSVMKAVDPKLDQIYLEMLEFVDVEQILAQEDEQTLSLFSASDLLIMLQRIAQSSAKLQTVCGRLSRRFQDEGEKIKIRITENNGKLPDEDTKQVQNWTKIITSFLNEGYTSPKKCSLINLFLDIVLVSKPFKSMPDLVDNLSQSIAIELSRQIALNDLCKSCSLYLEKLALIDKQIHDDLFTRFKQYLASVTPETCFDVYFTDGTSLSNQMSELLFERAVTVFNETKDASYFQRFIAYGKSIIGAEHNTRGKNLARLFSRFVDDFEFPTDKSVFFTITDLPSTSNMMKFFSKLLELKLLETKVVEKANKIIHPVHQFMVNFL